MKTLNLLLALLCPLGGTLVASEKSHTLLPMSAHAIILSLVLSAITTVTGFAQQSADVIVYGSTPGGFCAAIAAAREGASAILLEPTEHVGGLSTGGLSHCDSNQMRRETLLGLFDEWHRRVVKDYTDRELPAPYDAACQRHGEVDL